MGRSKSQAAEAEPLQRRFQKVHWGTFSPADNHPPAAALRAARRLQHILVRQCFGRKILKPIAGRTTLLETGAAAIKKRTRKRKSPQ
jgi:hypothetical protein